MVVTLRNAAYDRALCRTHRLACRVLCVGNLTVGGTGKTPTVLALAESLVRGGAKPCILLRGYAGTAVEPTVVGDGLALLADWPQAGDEAVLLARRLPGVPVVVGADRVRAGRLALERFRPDVLLLDDGFQHRRLFRDVDLVLLDAAEPFGGGRLLPRGRLREPARGLRRAHAVLVTRADRLAHREPVREAIRRVAPATPVAWARHRPTRVVRMGCGAEEALEALEGRKVFAVCGIAAPDGFTPMLDALGARVVGARAFPDHHPFTGEDHRAVSTAAIAAGAEWVVTTEKDAVRLRDATAFGLPTYAVRIALEVLDGGAALAAILGARLPEAQHG
jgi:tetraacyldisaccharide 4'-kinase